MYSLRLMAYSVTFGSKFLFQLPGTIVREARCASEEAVGFWLMVTAAWFATDDGCGSPAASVISTTSETLTQPDPAFSVLKVKV